MVRYRIDGVLRAGDDAPAQRRAPARLAHQDHVRARHRRPAAAAGRPRARVGRRRARSTSASRRCRRRTGEKVVIRILDASGDRAEPRGAGRCTRTSRTPSTWLLEAREGIILVTGPTGSGKTTTLYAALRRCRTRGVNIVTVEDPVEYRLRRHRPGAGATRRRASPSPPRCARSCGRTPTSCWSARSAIGRPPDRDPGLAHRPPRAVHAAHQRRAQRRHPAGGHRDGAVQDRVRASRRRGPAAHAPLVQGVRSAQRRAGARADDPIYPAGHQAVPRGRLPRVRHHGVSRAKPPSSKSAANSWLAASRSSKSATAGP